MSQQTLQEVDLRKAALQHAVDVCRSNPQQIKQTAEEYLAFLRGEGLKIIPLEALSGAWRMQDIKAGDIVKFSG